MKNTGRALLAVGLVLLLCGTLTAACAEGAQVDGYLGKWQSGNILMEVERGDEGIECRVMRIQGKDERDLLRYGSVKYDKDKGYIQCMGYTRTHEVYNRALEKWEETDWALSDLYFAELTLSEDGATLLWTDEQIEKPIVLKRPEATEDGKTLAKRIIVLDPDKAPKGKRPFVRALVGKVDVRKGPGAQYDAVARLGYLDEVAVIDDRIVQDWFGYYWAKVTVSVSQTDSVEGWVCSKDCTGCWN